MNRKNFYAFALIKSLIISFVSFAQVTGVEAIGITVKDMDRSVRFYTEVLGFTKINDTGYQGESIEKLQGLFGLNARVVRLQLGEEFIELTDYLTSGGRSIPEDAKSNDLFFQHIAIVVSDMEKAYSQLKKYNVEHVSTSPQTLPKTIPAAAGIKAFYFRDPDDHNLELIYFPEGKGQEKWQRNKGRLFLGIDHTAIGVSNSERSHAVYNDILGIRKQGDSWNKGTEQEHLNNVEGASLHITGYRAAQGPGIEFLQYLVPGPGKPYPADSRSDDIWHWQIILIVRDAETLYKELKSTRSKFLSKQLIHQNSYGIITKSFIIRDPDGHALLLKEYVNH